MGFQFWFKVRIDIRGLKQFLWLKKKYFWNSYCVFLLRFGFLLSLFVRITTMRQNYVFLRCFEFSLVGFLWDSVLLLWVIIPKRSRGEGISFLFIFTFYWFYQKIRRILFDEGFLVLICNRNPKILHLGKKSFSKMAQLFQKLFKLKIFD